MERAATAFGDAAAIMPSFASAAANWGATLGELDRPEEALAAFSRALAADPDNHQALNNLGVVSRELGRLGESEAAFRQVIALTPGLAFGHYNLGHTLFLQGRYQASLAAYLTGQRNDPARNPVQASRLALARLATGDAAGRVARVADLHGDVAGGVSPAGAERHPCRGMGAALDDAGAAGLAPGGRLADRRAGSSLAGE